MVSFFLGQQRGYTKYPSISVFFVVCGTAQLMRITGCSQNWPLRSDLKPGDSNILHQVLVDWKNIIFPPSQTKLGLMKQFVKALPTEGNCFKYLISAFPSLSLKKMKAGVFYGPQIWQFIKDEHFMGTKTTHQNNAWLVIQKHCQRLSWKHTSTELHRNCPATLGELQNAWLQLKHQITFFI